MKRSTFFKPVYIFLLFAIAGTAHSQPEQSLIESLQNGGMVVVMRHASSPRDLPDADSASEGNETLERQLDEQGIADSQAFGEALGRLGISVSMTGSSPTFRAMQTARLAGLDNVLPLAELGNEDMQESGEQKAAWLRQLTGKAPPSGNFLLITHTPNIRAAFPDAGRTSEGEALVFDPAVSSTEPVGRIEISAWPDL